MSHLPSQRTVYKSMAKMVTLNKLGFEFLFPHGIFFRSSQRFSKEADFAQMRRWLPKLRHFSTKGKSVKKKHRFGVNGFTLFSYFVSYKWFISPPTSNTPLLRTIGDDMWDTAGDVLTMAPTIGCVSVGLSVCLPVAVALKKARALATTTPAYLLIPSRAQRMIVTRSLSRPPFV